MIDYFKTTLSRLSFCKKCKQRIRTSMRGVKEIRTFGHIEYHYYCLKCCEKVIGGLKDELNIIQKKDKGRLKIKSV